MQQDPNERIRRILQEIRVLRSGLYQIALTVESLQLAVKDIAVAIGSGEGDESEQEVNYTITGKPCVLDPEKFAVSAGKTIFITNETEEPVTVTLVSGLFVFDEGTMSTNEKGEIVIEIPPGESVTLQVATEPSVPMGYYKLSCWETGIGGGGTPKAIHVDPPGE